MTSSTGATRATAPPMTLVVALVPVAVAVNFLANYVVALLRLPIYLDTIGTFLAAALLGPWWGALAGVLTNVVGIVPNGISNVLFAGGSIAAALVWGYGLRSLRLGGSGVAFFVLAVVVGIVTGALATPIVLYVYGGATSHPSDLITAAFSSLGLERGVLVSSILSSIPDKVISAYIGLAVIGALPLSATRAVVLPEQPGARRIALAVAGLIVGLVLAAVAVALQPPA